MSMPPPPNQPPHHPYGGPVPPPQQPGAYGPPPAQGFPQQYPGPGAWGQPPMGPPPKKKLSAGAIVAIVLGSLVLVGGLGYAAKLGISGAGDSFPEATHKLVVPKTLLGEYTLTKDASETEGKEVEDTFDPTVKDAKAAIAQYTGKDSAVLVVSGFHGRLKDPEGTRAAILSGAAKDKGTTLVVPPKEYTPAGLGVTVSCQVTQSKDTFGTSTLPMCAWGDDNTASFVAVVTAESATADPKDVDLAELAETTAKVRAEMRKPIS